MKSRSFATHTLVCATLWSVNLQAQEKPPTEEVGMHRHTLIVVGAGGTEEYDREFHEAAEKWEQVSQRYSQSTLVIRQPADETTSQRITDDRSTMIQWIQQQKEHPSHERWLILIGHGTYQQKVANFNLRGPDISADELAKFVDAVGGVWRVIVAASSSSPFLQSLSGRDRIVISATKSGSEQNHSRFASFLAKAITDQSADLDHDGGVSLLEAYLEASANVAQWYEDEDRLASEQALLDDNGDRRGTPAVFFRGTRAVKAAADGLQLDGLTANQTYLIYPPRPEGWTIAKQQRLDTLERELESIRQDKANLEESVYLKRLEPIFLEIAKTVLVSEAESNE